ncbi:MAG: Atu2307/SP_0267 family LLM class monooxygenase [Candidatus Izemoplasma sp.]|nr:Atu2307/SP_0267 family LLM class monooxygenase [Candidatus Izemoplasma sp.]
MKNNFELGITTFAEIMENPETGETISYDERIRQVVDEIVFADELGLSYFGVGEHHRKDFASSAPHIILAAAASKTQNITLGSAVTVLSSDDPVRVFQNFATINAISHGRAEILAGRGSFTESFPLFGYDLNDYDDLYKEKLNLLINIRDNEIVDHDGQLRPSIDLLGVYPRPSEPLTIALASGGSRGSVIRAARLGLPLFLAIIGGEPLRFKPLVELYDRVYEAEGHDPAKRFVSIHSHGYITDDKEKAFEEYYPSIEPMMSRIGKERGWGPYSRRVYNHALSMEGALYVGDPQYVAEKINYLRDNMNINRFALHVPVGYMDHEKVLKTIELLAKEVKPKLQ